MSKPHAVEPQVRAQLAKEGLAPTRWSNGPHDVYGAHEHPYGKVLYVVEGDIEFTIESTGQRVRLRPGERLDIPPHTSHSAVVGSAGVACLEAHLPARGGA